MMYYDAAVTGAGPAGAMAAQKLAEKGVKTALIEAKTMPRHKTCGGAVTGKALPYLDENFYDITEDRLDRIVFRYNYKDGIGYKPRSSYAYTVKRDIFDHYLAERAEKAGTYFFQGQPVEKIERDGDYFNIYTRDESFKARTVVGADGAASLAAKTFGLAGKRQGLALEALIPLEKVRAKEYCHTALLDYGLVPGGYGWIFPKSDHLNVGLGTFKERANGIKELFYEHIERCFPYLGEDDYTVYGHIIPTYCSGTLCIDYGKSGILAVGDAAGLVDPFSGEGIHYALESGAVAAEVLEGFLEGKTALEEYDRRIRENILSQLEASKKIADYFYALTGPAHYCLVKKRRAVREFISTIAGSQSYQQLAGWLKKNLLREVISRVPDDRDFFNPGALPGN